jgi:hypothetical protein
VQYTQAATSTSVTIHQSRYTDLIPPSTSVRDLAISFDSDLPVRLQVNKVAGTHYTLCFGNPAVFVAQFQPVVSLVVSRVDYCNSALAGVSMNPLRRFQSVMSTAARTVADLHRVLRISACRSLAFIVSGRQNNSH